jgi:hypothetical protein
MSKKEKIPVDIERISRILGKIYKILQKKTKSPVEALFVLKIIKKHGKQWENGDTVSYPNQNFL